MAKYVVITPFTHTGGPPAPRRKSCVVCRDAAAVTKGRCSTCYAYFHRTGRDRSPELIEAAAAKRWQRLPDETIPAVGLRRPKTEHIEPHDVVADEVIDEIAWEDRYRFDRYDEVAYEYERHHGEITDADPAWMGDTADDVVVDKRRYCTNCGLARRVAGERCDACRKYLARRGEDRPQRLIDNQIRSMKNKKNKNT